jgi:hypothetical protein
MLLDLLKRSPGMTSREATALLTERGVAGTRKTPLSDRVYHELYRMLHAGVVCRRGVGYAMREVEDHPIEDPSIDDAPSQGAASISLS